MKLIKKHTKYESTVTRGKNKLNEKRFNSKVVWLELVKGRVDTQWCFDVKLVLIPRQCIPRLSVTQIFPLWCFIYAKGIQNFKAIPMSHRQAGTSRWRAKSKSREWDRNENRKYLIPSTFARLHTLSRCHLVSVLGTRNYNLQNTVSRIAFSGFWIHRWHISTEIHLRPRW